MQISDTPGAEAWTEKGIELFIQDGNRIEHGVSAAKLSFRFEVAARMRCAPCSSFSRQKEAFQRR